MIKRSEELGIREKLVIIVQSEMGRTLTITRVMEKTTGPLAPSCLWAEAKGNRVIGATDEKQLLKPINPMTLAIDEKSGIRTRPEHIHQALRELAGIEDHPFSKNIL